MMDHLNQVKANMVDLHSLQGEMDNIFTNQTAKTMDLQDQMTDLQKKFAIMRLKVREVLDIMKS